MDYVDKTLIKLAEAATRAALFDEAALAQVLSAAYDVESANVEGPFQPVFDEFRVGLVLSSAGEVEGAWNVAGNVDRTEAKFYVSGLQPTVPIRVDGYWRGSIQARTTVATGRVSAVKVAWPDLLTIDAEIEAALGTLPSNPSLLEQERRARILARIRAGLHQPAAFTEEMFSALLTRERAASAGELLEHIRGGVRTGTLQVSFAVNEPAAPSQRNLPLAGVFLIRNAGFSVAQLLMESRMVRSGLKPIGLERPPDPAIKSRESLIVIWVVPETVFDDGDWPGGSSGMSGAALRAARRNEAGQWLAREGIGLVATAP
jgi:hypothetical protein